MNLRRPLWPRGRLNLTTPLHLLLVAACVAGGGWLYARGYTYEGSALAYMLGGVIFAYPYYAARYTAWMTYLVLGSLVPATIWLQNKGVEVELWHYPAEKPVLASITRAGEGWGNWTRHLWLGNDMPAMEYVFYPLFGFFHMAGFALFSHWLPDRWFEQPHKTLQHAFLAVMAPVFGLFVWAYFSCRKPGVTDYTYWMTGLIGFATTFVCWAASPNFRAYGRTPAFWIWVGAVGVVFMTAWEFFHVCLNHDWVYDLRHTYPPLYRFNGAGIPFTDWFGYLVTATVFQALMFFFITRLGHLVIRDERLVPFGCWRCRPAHPAPPPTLPS
jgi:hypothetical protein